jgi:FtsP/CotA-like multicopper oxidase with cupredoxin domain
MEPSMPHPFPVDRRRFLTLSSGGAIFLAGCANRSGTAGRPSATVGPDDPAVIQAERARSDPGSKVSRHTLRAATTTVALGSTSVSTWAYNDTVPGPEVRVTEGDTLEVAIRNDLPEPTTIHWHGLALRNDMDGVPDLTQTSIPPGESFTYRFVAAQPGTYWFHPHMGLQLDRGLYAPLVVEERSGAGGYDIDQVIVLDDWLDGVAGSPEKTYEGLTSMGGSGSDGMSGMDNMGAGGMSMFRSKVLGGDAGDVAYPLHLINGRPPTDRAIIGVPNGGRARLRFINAGSDTAYRVALGGHRKTVTHSDGFAVDPVEVDALLIGMGERYDVLVEPSSGSWPLIALAEGKQQAAEAVVQTADVRDGGAPTIGTRPRELEGRLLRYSDLHATEANRLQNKKADVDQAVELTGSMMPYSWAFDGKPFADHDPLEIHQGQRVRLSFKNTTSMWHPIHLHGHTFRLGRQADGPRKDTVAVLPGETVSIEFDANNPGQWMAHCHNTYHLEKGMAMLVSYVR